jgi:hypothetical protein
MVMGAFPSLSTRIGLTAFLAGILLALGCQSRPRAPVLTNEPVFQSEEGFRFLVPEGWIMTARTTVPPGPAKSEVLLVQYLHAEGDTQANLEVSLIDLPEDTNLAAYLSSPAYSAGNWRQVGSSQFLEVAGRSAMRYRFTALGGGKPLAREVTIFRQGQRVYLFTILFAPQDNTALEQANRAVRSLVWTK